MKNIITSLLFTIVFSSCATHSTPVLTTTTPELTKTPTQIKEIPSATPSRLPTFTSTPLIPCPPIGMPVQVGEIKIIFHEAVPVQACHDIQKYVQMTNNIFNALGYKTGRIEVSVFFSFQAVTDYMYDIARMAGCNPDSKDIIMRAWIRGGAQSTRGAAFFLANNAWNSHASIDNASPIVHEITQVTMINILGSCQRKWQVPDWYAHGLAEYNAATFTAEWGLQPWEEDLYKCQYKLTELNAGEECVYMEAQMAFQLLKSDTYGGKDRGLDVILEMAKGKSFNRAFYDIYKIGVSAFSDEFDVYRLNGYKLPQPPTAPTP